ncbi:hypothetical protein D3C73_1315160 [compost metagenome]
MGIPRQPADLDTLTVAAVKVGNGLFHSFFRLPLFIRLPLFLQVITGPIPLLKAFFLPEQKHNLLKKDMQLQLLRTFPRF